MKRHLHIVCLDAPWPADYGGAIDMFCKIEALQQAGIAIHLHYFSYNDREPEKALAPLCESIHRYSRTRGVKGLSWSKPYIVSTRSNEQLLVTLNEDNFPVLLEGLHTTGIIATLRADKKVLVRMHNDEPAYYGHLAAATGNVSKKLFFAREKTLLKKYQHQLPQKAWYGCITQKDEKTFHDEYGLQQVLFLPAFIPYTEIKAEEGIGNFCLYHGNLSVPENEKAALWLLQQVFSKIKVPLVIAGKNPSQRLTRMAHLYQHSCLVANPGEKEMNDLVRKAHINLLPSFSSSGIKFKLLHALFEGRHCVVNPAMVEGTGLEAACHVGNSASAIASIVMQLHHRPFEAEEIALRKKLMGTVFDNAANAQRIIQCLY